MWHTAHIALVIAAHGSADPRFAVVVQALATRVRGLRAGLDVRIGYLDHGPPHLAEVVAAGDGATPATVVPLLLSGGFHARADVPAQAPGATITPPVGPDERLAVALADRLLEAGYDGVGPVTLVAAGSADEQALADVRSTAGHLARRLRVPVEAAFVSAGRPRLSELEPSVVASYLLAPGSFHEAVRRCGAPVVSEPLGDHPAVAEVILARYDAGQVPGRTAPA
ncbi:MAG TPA: CbiX/SirB N-terminal domain-containing protein [Mycobacteriales bacterium]|nr:CbiX/SirB N-terminal domain-containing protein [Mycobacteriales bacterium]